MKPRPHTVAFPSHFSLSAREDHTDYSLTATDMTFQARVRCRINATFDGHDGREKLSGWHRSASTRCTFHVWKPINEAAGKAAVRAALHRMARETLTPFIACEDYIQPIIIGINIGPEATGPIIRLTASKKPRTTAYVSDYIADVKDSFRHQIQAFHALCQTP